MMAHMDVTILVCAVVHEGLNKKVEQPNVIAEKCKIEILGKELLTMARNEIWKMLTGNGGGGLSWLQVQSEIEEEKYVVLRNE